MRREFLCAAAGVAASRGWVAPIDAALAPSDVERWRREFPALQQEVNGHSLIYLDTAATALRPRAVIDAVTRFYSHDNANPGASLHTLARRAAAALERARATLASFIGAHDPLEIVFTRGTTEGLNLVAACWGRANMRPGDEILISAAEHASNMLPWRQLAREAGARLVYFGVDDRGQVDLDDFTARLGPRTRIVAFSHVSNVLGLVNPVAEMCRRARADHRIVVVDGAQSVPHFPVNVSEMGCDFMAFSSHKMLGPMGVGVLWGRRALLESMPPYQCGSNMAHEVDLESQQWSDGALKYSAGTPNVSGPVGLAAAVDFIRGIGFPAIIEHERRVTRLMLKRLRGMPGVRLLGRDEADERVSLFSFTVIGRKPTDLLRALDAQGIAIRAGDLASLPLMQRFGAPAAARASCYLYTSLEEVDRFAIALQTVVERG